MRAFEGEGGSLGLSVDLVTSLVAVVTYVLAGSLCSTVSAQEEQQRKSGRQR